MSLKIKEIPETERPYEKLELYGEKSLSNSELLAIIIKTGTKEETSIQLAHRILNLSNDPQMGDLNFLNNISLQQFMQIKGIGRVKAIQIKAVCELARRMVKPSNYRKILVKSTKDVADIVMEELRLEKMEHVKMFLLNSKNEILKCLDVAKGGNGSANVDIKEIVAETLKIKAPKVILVHNHPSGNPTPSDADIKFTDKLYNACELFNIELVDHIVIGDNKYKSVFEEVRERAQEIKNGIRK